MELYTMSKPKTVDCERVNEWVEMIGYNKAIKRIADFTKANTHSFPKTGRFINIDTSANNGLGTAEYVVSGGSGAVADSKEIASTRAKLKSIIAEDTAGTGIQTDINGVKRVWQITCYTLESRKDNNKSVKNNESE